MQRLEDDDNNHTIHSDDNNNTSNRTPPSSNLNIKSIEIAQSRPVSRSIIRGASNATSAAVDDSGGESRSRTNSNAVALPNIVKRQSLLVQYSDSSYSNRRQSIFQLSDAERAFLPREVQYRLGKAGQLPPTPSVFPAIGAALFVDVAGFTALGESLRKEHSPLEAASLLSSRITVILSTLTKICIEYRGDVAKFAGDALLCLWDSSENDALNQARHCAVEMLSEMRRQNVEGGTNLQIHGGLAFGGLMHFHVGSPDDELRSYLVAGAAVTAATDVLHIANAGEIIFVDNRQLTSKGSNLSAQSSVILSVIQKQETPMSTGFGSGNALLPGSGDSDQDVQKPNNNNNNNSTTTPMVLTGVLGRNNSIVATFLPSPGSAGSLVSNLLRSSSAQGGGSFKDNRKRAPTYDLGTINEHAPQKSPNEFNNRSSNGPLKIEPRRSSLKRLSSTYNTLVSEEEVKRSGGRISISEIDIISSPKPVAGTMVDNSPLPSPTSKPPGAGMESFISLPASVNGADDDNNNNNEAGVYVLAPNSIIREVLTADSVLENVSKPSRGRVGTEDDPILREGLPRIGNAYIPRALRKGLRTGFKESQMRDRVAILFVGLEDLALSGEEIAVNQVNDSKLDMLSDAFVGMTRIAHSFKGEIRDLLFDDKGCVYIAAFGAHEEDQSSSSSPDLNALKAAIAIVTEVSHARIGISVGTCFIGMCGIAKRNDFVVMGHEVNMAARYMSCAQPGGILVSPEIYESARDLFQMSRTEIYFGKDLTVNPDDLKPDHPKSVDGIPLRCHIVYSPDPTIGRRPSFQAQYIYGQRDKDFFVGREKELELIETCIANIMPIGGSSDPKKGGKTSKRGTVILLESPSGMGKSTLVSRAKMLGRGRIKIVIGLSSLVQRQNRPFFPWSQVLESFMGLNSRMSAKEYNRIIELYDEKDKKIDRDALAVVLPWISSGKTLTPEDLSKPKAVELTNELLAQVTACLVQIFKNGRTTNGFSGARGILVILEDIHMMDDASLQLLSSMIKSLSLLRSFVMMITVRIQDVLKIGDILSGHMGDDDPIEDNELLDDILDRCRTIPLSLKIQMTGLNRIELESYVKRILGVEGNCIVDGSVLDKIHEVTDGFPVYMTHLILWLTELKYLIRDTSLNRVIWNPENKEKIDFPHSVGEIISKRFLLLEPPVKRVLMFAASAGHEFTAEYIASFDFVRQDAQKDLDKVQSIRFVLDCFLEGERSLFITHRKNSSFEESKHIWEWKNEKALFAIRGLLQPNLASDHIAAIKQSTAAYNELQSIRILSYGLFDIDD